MILEFRRLCGGSEVHEIPQKLQSNFLALFGMKLCGEDVVAPHGGRESLAISGAGSNDGRVRWLREKAVDEIDITALGNTSEEWTIGSCNFELVPSDLRNLKPLLGGKPDDVSLEDSQSGGTAVELLTLLEERLVANADTQEWPPGSNELTRGFQQALPMKRIDAIIKSAYSRQDYSACMRHFGGVLYHVNGGANLQQRLLDAAQVSRTVIYQSYHATERRTERGVWQPKDFRAEGPPRRRGADASIVSYCVLRTPG
jgi:hypothetical protein